MVKIRSLCFFFAILTLNELFIMSWIKGVSFRDLTNLELCTARQDCDFDHAVTVCTRRGRCSIVFDIHLTWHGPQTDIKWWRKSSDVCTLKAIKVSIAELCWLCKDQSPSWFLGPGPPLFLFCPAWKPNKSEAGGTQNSIGALHIVHKASSSTFLGWLGSGPPVQEYCSSSTVPQTWPQQNHSCLH